MTRAEKLREYRVRWDEIGLCTRCGTHPSIPGQKRCESCLAKAKANWARHSEALKPIRQQKHQALKLEVMNAYGGAVCACCGDIHLEFLSINHINGDGSQHRREMGWKNRLGNGGGNIYGWLKARQFPPGFNVLCMNCNFALGHAGYCPHQKVS